MHFSVSSNEENPNQFKERFRKGHGVRWYACKGSGGRKRSGPEIPGMPMEHHHARRGHSVGNSRSPRRLQMSPDGGAGQWRGGFLLLEFRPGQAC